ncbi:MAG TPA: sulfite exporter TauE/SafE family protein, partial [Epsilonproteobacteria bacterium]|nr:sulfite exporter TauE/SafE family protein [Campylobacterota bacterium]
MNSIDIVSIVTVAFLGSIGHCIGMCGGIIVAYS